LQGSFKNNSEAEGESVDTFTAIAFLFGIAAILSFINDRYLHIQHDIGLLILACVTTVILRILSIFFPSVDLGLLKELTRSFNLNDTLLKGVLCFMLFRGSVRVSWGVLRDQRWLTGGLAFVGTTVSCVLTGAIVYSLLTAFGIPVTLPQALLFGALIAATDPIASLAILSKIGLPRKLETVVDGESLLNDGVAVVLFTIFAASAIEAGVVSPAAAGTIFVQEVLGGALLGLIGWMIIHYLMQRSGSYGTGLLITLGAVSLIYDLALHLEISGPIATVIAGLLSGNITAPRMFEGMRAPLRTFWTGLDSVLNALLFVFVGFHVILINPLQNVIPGVPGLVSIVAVLIARALSVAAVVGGLNLLKIIHADFFGLTQLLTWSGLRGGLSLALAVSLHDSPWKPLVLNMTFAVVVFSIVVQGLTIRRMFSTERLAGLLR
jgi:CPA1 family monovalent cation:H+ antiporter